MLGPNGRIFHHGKCMETAWLIFPPPPSLLLPPFWPLCLCQWQSWAPSPDSLRRLVWISFCLSESYGSRQVASPTHHNTEQEAAFCFSDCFREANRKKIVHVMVHFHHKKDRAWSLWNTRCSTISSDIPYHVNYKRFSILSSNVVKRSGMSIKYVFFWSKS